MSKRLGKTLKKQVSDKSSEVLALIEEARTGGATTLDLSNKYLTVLPEMIGQLTELEELHLDDNQLIELPEIVGQLIKLRSLYLDENQLTELPAWLRNLKLLKQLYLHGNTGLGLPVELLGPT